MASCAPLQPDECGHTGRPTCSAHEVAPRAAATIRGATLLELCAAVALAGAAAVSLLGGLQPLSCAFRIEAARAVLVDALLEARRNAYRSDAPASLETRAGAGAVVLMPSGVARALGDGVALVSAPADGDVQFRATGSADNATLSIACGQSTASVVVNQRGVVR